MKMYRNESAPGDEPFRKKKYKSRRTLKLSDWISLNMITVRNVSTIMFKGKQLKSAFNYDPKERIKDLREQIWKMTTTVKQ